MGLALGFVAGIAIWCAILLAVTGISWFGWLAAVFGFVTLLSLFIHRPRRSRQVRPHPATSPTPAPVQRPNPA